MGHLGAARCNLSESKATIGYMDGVLIRIGGGIPFVLG